MYFDVNKEGTSIQSGFIRKKLIKTIVIIQKFI